jgi:hypothetical protein
MAFAVNSLASTDQIVGLVRFRVHYSFRQRVSNENGPVLNQSIRFQVDEHGRLIKYVSEDTDEDDRASELTATMLPSLSQS